MILYRVVWKNMFAEGTMMSQQTDDSGNKFMWLVRDAMDAAGIDEDIHPLNCHPTPDNDHTRGSRLRDFWRDLSTRETPLGGELLRKDYKFAFASKRSFRMCFKSKKICRIYDTVGASVLILQVPQKHVVTSAHQALFRYDKAEIEGIMTLSALRG